MGRIARMDPKPPSSCWYMSKPSPPIGQNRGFKIERPGSPLKGDWRGEGFTPENFKTMISSYELEVMARTCTNILRVV